mmetsp:Transcript_2408/g.7112  ORF Transcript_2408/g.7112 Transcript_2408/m.7112 type:complete len:83 (-) Transcript_2408:1866-2114(-)
MRVFTALVAARGLGWRSLSRHSSSPAMTMLETSFEDAKRFIVTDVGGGPRMRFAPSPTGSLHVGGARTALHVGLCLSSSATI